VVPTISPFSAVAQLGVLILLALRDLRGDFRHYILNSFGSVGQRQAEVLEQDGEAGFGAVDSAKAHVLAGACGQVRAVRTDLTNRHDS